MVRVLNKLTAAKVKAAPPGKYSDGGGLWLFKRKDGGGQWFLRVSIHGRRREMGLGSLQLVSLKQARDEAEKWRAVALQGEDPVKERQGQRRKAVRNLHLLRDIANDAFESRKAELKEDGAAGRWFSPLKLHVLPKLGGVPVSQIDQHDIRDVMTPIWHSKPGVAVKAMNRLSICLKHAAALDLDVDLQATAKAKELLGRQRHAAKHIPAMPWQDVPAFYASLDQGTVAHLALRLLILTAVRSKPLRFLRLDDLKEGNWTIPGELQKGLRDRTPDFVVPLSKEAQAVIEQAKPFARDGFMFPSVRRGVISDATMSRLMERRGLSARPHGFRSSFRDWCAEVAGAPQEVAETALGHVAGGAVERAYRRTDFLEQRRELMEKWSACVSPKDK